MSVKSKTVFHDRACVRCAAKEIKCYGTPGHCCNACKDAKSGCIHSDRKAGEYRLYLILLSPVLGIFQRARPRSLLGHLLLPVPQVPRNPRQRR
jgi:hypothetical protein